MIRGWGSGALLGVEFGFGYARIRYAMARAFRPVNPAEGSAADFWWRQLPGAREFLALDTAVVECGARPTVFLQSDAVDWVGEAGEGSASSGPIEALRDAVDWWVCIGSWRRRSPSGRSDDLPAPFRPASLTQWIDRVSPPASPGPDGAPRYEILFVIDRQPDGPWDRSETLEPVLAAAALERDVAVLLRGPGQRHLVGPGAEAWDQLKDFDLATLFLLDEGEMPLSNPDRGRLIDAQRAARLCGEAGTMFVL